MESSAFVPSRLKGGMCSADETVKLCILAVLFRWISCLPLCLSVTCGEKSGPHEGRGQQKSLRFGKKRIFHLPQAVLALRTDDAYEQEETRHRLLHRQTRIRSIHPHQAKELRYPGQGNVNNGVGGGSVDEDAGFNRYSHQSARILLAVHVYCPDRSISAPQSTIELRPAPFIRQQRRAGMNCTYSRESIAFRWPRSIMFCRYAPILPSQHLVGD